MEFFIGTHHATQRWFDLGIPLFVSRRVLTEKKKLPKAKCKWALDSGGFTELSLYGEWRTSEEHYVEDVKRYAEEIGHLAWAAPMDWMCEPFMLKKTGLPLYEHQMKTVENFTRLRQRLGELVVPVLQGWELDDYMRCVEYYERCGVELYKERLVGVGSVCRRQSTKEAARIFRTLADLHLKLHGFGVKIAGLQEYSEALTSSDSMAWSFEARRLKRRHDRQDALFDWPKKMLCGRMFPTDHKAKSCSNCVEWALKWRNNIVKDRLEEAA